MHVLDQHVNFTALAELIDHSAPRPSRQRAGSADLMVRVLLIQQLFNLSDEQMEF